MKVSGWKLDKKLKELMAEKKFFYEKNYRKIGINTEDDLPLKESLKFLTLIVNTDLIRQADNKFYPQIYFDQCFYEL